MRPPASPATRFWPGMPTRRQRQHLVDVARPLQASSRSWWHPDASRARPPAGIRRISRHPRRPRHPAPRRSPRRGIRPARAALAYRDVLAAHAVVGTRALSQAHVGEIAVAVGESPGDLAVGTRDHGRRARQGHAGDVEAVSPVTRRRAGYQTAGTPRSRCMSLAISATPERVWTPPPPSCCCPACLRPAASPRAAARNATAPGTAATARRLARRRPSRNARRLNS